MWPSSNATFLRTLLGGLLALSARAGLAERLSPESSREQLTQALATLDAQLGNFEKDRRSVGRNIYRLRNGAESQDRAIRLYDRVLGSTRALYETYASYLAAKDVEDLTGFDGVLELRRSEGNPS